MNKYQEALITLTDWFHSYTNENGIIIQERHITPAYVKAKKTIQELVDKEKPKKPKIEQQHDYVEHNYVCSYELAFCPKCALKIDFRDYYCKRCGQKLDWKQNEDEKES